MLDLHHWHPQRTFTGRLPNREQHIGVGASLLLALSVPGALWLARPIVLPVRTLNQAVVHLQSGQPVQICATEVAEFNELTDALARAAETLRDAGADLARQVVDDIKRACCAICGPAGSRARVGLVVPGTAPALLTALHGHPRSGRL